jgi:small subunit ribosomal protein S16
MAVRLRLKRFGRNHRSVYRVAAMESRNPRDGRVLEELGLYDPANRVVDQQVRLDAERIKHWLARGALPTDTVRHLLKKHGISLT